MTRQTFKKSALTLLVSALMSSTSTFAAVQTTQPTQQIHGHQPLIPVVGVTGQLKPGATVSISDLYWFIDPDNGLTDTEIDVSNATIQWYILDKDSSLPAYNDPLNPPFNQDADATDNESNFVIPRVDPQGNPINYKTNNKVLGFRIIPTTKNGLPLIGQAIEVPNAIKLGGSVIPPGVILPEIPTGLLPPEVTVTDPQQPIDPNSPDENPNLTGPGGPLDPKGDVTPPGDGTGIIYDKTKYIVRIGQDINNDGNPDSDKLIYDELGRADEIFLTNYQPVDRAGKLLLQADGKTPVTPISLSTLTPGIPMVNTKYVVGIYEVEYDGTEASPDWLVDYTTPTNQADGTYLVDESTLGTNLASQFQNSITWQIDGVEVASGALNIMTQENNDEGNASFGANLGSRVSQQNFSITVSYDDDLTSASNAGTLPAQ